MATKNPQIALYAWVIISDWVAEQMPLWGLSSTSKLLNHILTLWILMERHKLLDSTLEKLAVLEGYRSVDDLKKSLSDRFSKDED